MKNNVLIMAGGTGGHVIPALSVAKELKTQGYTIHWLGSPHGIENELVPDAGYQLHQISVSGLRGKGALALAIAPFKLCKAIWQTLKVIRETKPKLALGMGGFASGPGGLVAWILNIPLVVHEQNAYPGLTNKLLSRRSNLLLEAFTGTFTADKNAVSVGNPVRQDIVNIPEPKSRLAARTGKLNVLVVGGSLGAVAVNEAIIEATSEMEESIRPNIWHQTGKRNYDAVVKGYEEHKINAKISAFIADMAQAYEWADVIVCRSGALTVSEIMAAGVASILIPFPHAVDDHQTANAKFLVDEGAAILRPQGSQLSDQLINDLTTLADSREQIIKMAKAARNLAKPESAIVVARHCIEAIHG